MIDVTMARREADSSPTAVAVDVRFEDDSGSGIRLAQIRDRFDLLVFEDATDCRAALEASLPALPTARFPLRATATDCSGEITETAPFPLLPPTSTDPGVPVPCTPLVCAGSSSCTTARRRAVEERNRLVAQCRAARSLREQRDLKQRLITAFLVMAATLFLAAQAALGVPLLGAFMAVALTALAGVTLIAAARERVLLQDVRRRLAEARASVDEIRAVFRAAVDAVGAACCPACVFEDLSEPACEP